MRKAAIGLGILALLLIAVPAMAQSEDTIEIFMEGVERGSPGEVIPLRSEPVPESLVGATCTGYAQSQNNESQHDGNDFIISSGTTTAVIPNWEAVAGATTPMSGTLVLGTTVDVDLRLGGTVSSGGVLIVLSCAQPPPPTTAPPTPTTAPPTPTTAPPTPTTAPPGDTTTVPPPEGGISAGGGATAGDVNEAAILWLTGGAAALLGGATLLAMRRASGRRE